MSSKKVYFYFASLMPPKGHIPLQMLSGSFTTDKSVTINPEAFWNEVVAYIRSQCDPPAQDDCNVIINSLNRL